MKTRVTAGGDVWAFSREYGGTVRLRGSGQVEEMLGRLVLG